MAKVSNKVIRKCNLMVWPQKFAILKCKKPQKNAFAVIRDHNEVTVIIEERKAANYLEIEPGWRLITFNAVLGFGLVGFLAKICSKLAAKNISIFAISAYSTDHILVKEKDLNHAVLALKSIGFQKAG